MDRKTVGFWVVFELVPRFYYLQFVWQLFEVSLSIQKFSLDSFSKIALALDFPKNWLNFNIFNI